MKTKKFKELAQASKTDKNHSRSAVGDTCDGRRSKRFWAVVCLTVFGSGALFSYLLNDMQSSWTDGVSMTSSPSSSENEVLITDQRTQNDVIDNASSTSDVVDIASSTSDETYSKANITNSVDINVYQELDKADSTLEKGKDVDALKQFNRITLLYPQSPRAIYGKVRALSAAAERQQSNAVLEQALGECQHFLSLPDIPRSLLVVVAKFCAEKQSFRGWHGEAAKTLRHVVNIYPDAIDVWNDLGTKLLISGRNEQARQAFLRVLEYDENDGFALVHLGFIVNQIDNQNEAAIPLLQKGIASNAPGVIDSRFFFRLGDALYRANRHEEAYKTYELGFQKGLFLSMWQRSLYNVDRLVPRPWWTLDQTGNAAQLKMIAKHWEQIRDEGLKLLNKQGLFESESENLSDTGDWKQFTLYQRGRKNVANCKQAPHTCSLFDGFHQATSCSRGQIKFSVMHPGVHVWPHCGPTNCRIRAHLGLVVPEGPRIRVLNETKTWKVGEFIAFDDSFEHEVWHDGDSLRLVLIVDMWHPDLSDVEKRTLPPI